MATLRAGYKTVLLVVDVQVAVMRHAWEAARIINHIRLVVDKARGAGVPVIWVQQTDEELVYDTPDWQIVPELLPQADEVRIYKQFNSAFEQTSLTEVLAEQAATHIVLAGAATNWCIRSTAYGALERGYDLTLVADAHTTETLEVDDIHIEAVTFVHDLNLAMTWLSYPGRKNRTMLAADLDFGIEIE